MKYAITVWLLMFIQQNGSWMPYPHAKPYRTARTCEIVMKVLVHNLNKSETTKAQHWVFRCDWIPEGEYQSA